MLPNNTKLAESFIHRQFGAEVTEDDRGYYGF
jgi:hypothetical protein